MMTICARVWQRYHRWSVDPPAPLRGTLFQKPNL